MTENWNPNTATPDCDWCGECDWCANLGRPEPDAGDVTCTDDDCPRSGQTCPYPGAGCPANDGWRYCPRCGRGHDWAGATSPGAPCMGCGRYPSAREVTR